MFALRTRLLQAVKVIGVGCGLGIFWSLLFWMGIFRTWQPRIADVFFRPTTPSSQIVIITIDDTSLQAIGRWPWPRTVYAELLKKLGQNPAVVAFDISFFEKSPASEDAVLAEALKQSSVPIVLVSEFTNQNDLLRPLFATMGKVRTGFTNVRVDADGVVRSTATHASIADGQVMPSFSWQVAEAAGRPPSTPQAFEPARIVFAGPPDTFPHYSFTDVLSGQVAPDVFKDKIILVGATAADLHDYHPVAVSGSQEMAGVEIQANSLHTLLSGKRLELEPVWLTMSTILMISVISLSVCMMLSIEWSLIALLASVIGYVLYVMFWFDAGVIRELLFPLIVLVSNWVMSVIFKYTYAQQQRRFIKKAFAYYLSPAVLTEVLKHPSKLQLGGTKKLTTILFSDIAGFTSFSERLEPEELTEFLNEYLTAMTDVVFEYRGVLDKYIGDAVMAFWGAPVKDDEQALHACQTALAMQEKIKLKRDDWAKRFKVDNFQVRVGINTGEVVVGNFGSNKRFDYTVLGDHVNLASRLESINKQYGTLLMISQSTYDLVKDEVSARLLDIVAVKGKKQGIKVYELRGMGEAEGDEKDLLHSFEAARLLYQEGKFSDALKAFTKLAEDFLDDQPTRMYIDRCQNLKQTPPQEWDGIYRATSK